MKIRSRRLLVASATAAIAFGGLTAAQAADTSHTVRPGDIDTTTAHTGDGATYEFLKEGIRVDYTNLGDYVRAIFDTDVDLADVHQVTFDWTGTGYGKLDTQAGQDDKSTAPIALRYNVDADGDGSWDCQLVGELTYGGEAVWLNKDAQDAPDSDEPADFCANAAPNDGDTGYDSDGTLDSWASALTDASQGTDPVVVQAGFVASDNVSRGLLRSISLGDVEYSFSSDDAAPEPVDTTATVTRSSGYGVPLTFKSTDAGGAPQGDLVSWVVKVNGTTAFSDTMGNGEMAYYRLFKSPIKGTSVVDVYKDGKKVATYRLG